jgi:hypothetical protein
VATVSWARAIGEADGRRLNRDNLSASARLWALPTPNLLGVQRGGYTIRLSSQAMVGIPFGG